MILCSKPTEDHSQTVPVLGQALPFAMLFSDLFSITFCLAEPPPPLPRRRSAPQPSPQPPRCAPPSAQQMAMRPCWTRLSCRKRPQGHGNQRQSEPRLTAMSSPQSCPAGLASNSRLHLLKPWSRGLYLPPDPALRITIAEDRGKASSTTTLWTSSTQPRAPSSTVEKRVKVNPFPCRNRSSEHSVRPPRSGQSHRCDYHTPNFW